MPKSTASDVYLHAVGNAARLRGVDVPQQQRDTIQMPLPPPPPPAPLVSTTPDSSWLLGPGHEVEPEIILEEWEVNSNLSDAAEPTANLTAELTTNYVAERTAHPESIANPTGKPCSALVKELNLTLLELVNREALDAVRSKGRPLVMTEQEKDNLVAFVKRDFGSRRLRLRDMRRECGLAHVSDSAVYQALKARGMRCYR